jgi:hypothetical protein
MKRKKDKIKRRQRCACRPVNIPDAIKQDNAMTKNKRTNINKQQGEFLILDPLSIDASWQLY